MRLRLAAAKGLPAWALSASFPSLLLFLSPPAAPLLALAPPAAAPQACNFDHANMHFVQYWAELYNCFGHKTLFCRSRPAGFACKAATAFSGRKEFSAGFRGVPPLPALPTAAAACGGPGPPPLCCSSVESTVGPADVLSPCCCCCCCFCVAASGCCMLVWDVVGKLPGGWPLA